LFQFGLKTKKIGRAKGPPDDLEFQVMQPETSKTWRRNYLAAGVEEGAVEDSMAFFLLFFAFLAFFAGLAGAEAAGVLDIEASSAKTMPVTPRNITAIKAAKKRFIKSLLKVKIVVDHYFNNTTARRPSARPLKAGILCTAPSKRTLIYSEKEPEKGLLRPLARKSFWGFNALNEMEFLDSSRNPKVTLT